MTINIFQIIPTTGDPLMVEMPSQLIPPTIMPIPSEFTAPAPWNVQFQPVFMAMDVMSLVMICVRNFFTKNLFVSCQF